MTTGAHYEIAIDDMIEHIKADKSIIQPWRNDAIAQLRRAKAFIRMGLTSTNRTDLPSDPEPTCTCPEGGTRKSCPLHGAQA